MPANSNSNVLIFTSGCALGLGGIKYQGESELISIY